MKRWEKYTFTTLSAILTITGVAYFWMKWMLETDDPFAVVNHPLQPLMLQLHILVAPAFLVVFGIIFNSHIGRKIGKQIPNRRSGMLSLVTLAIMTASGYLLQTLTDPLLHQAALVSHLASGGVFAGAYTVHLAISIRMWQQARRAQQHAAAA
jgi:hypothetical protein